MIEVTSDPTPDGGCVITYTDITARARAEAALQEQAATLRATLDNLRHGVVVHGPDRRMRFANALAEELSGHRPGTLRPGRGFDELLAELLEGDELANSEAQILGHSARTADRSKSHVYVRRKPDGRVVKVRSDPMPDGGFIVTTIDVTRLVQAEAEARDRAEMLATALESMRHGCLIYGPDDRLLVANTLAATGAGLAPEDLLPGRSRTELVALQHARGVLGEGPAAAAKLHELATRDLRRPYQQHRTLPDGRVIEVVTVPTPTGGIVVTYTDITALAAAEAAARERAGLLQTMQDTMRHGIALFGRDQRLVIANPLAAGLAGLQPEELRPGLTAADIARTQRDRGVFGSGPAAAAECERVCRQDRTQPRQIRRAMPDGRIVDSASDPTPDGGFVITWTDVTAVVRAEAAADRRAATLQAIIENMRHGVALFGADRRLMAANRLLQELGGFAAGALRPGRSFEEVVAEQTGGAITGDPALDRTLVAQALAADRSRPLRHVRPSHDGRVLEITSDPMPDGGFVIGVSDITALARAEAEAKQRAQIQAVMLDTIRHGITLYGPDRRLIAVNRLSSRINGSESAGFGPGTRYDDVVRYLAGIGGLGPDPEAAAARLIGLDRSRSHHYQRRSADGRLIDIHSDPTPDGGFVITVTDITALAAAEAAANPAPRCCRRRSTTCGTASCCTARTAGCWPPTRWPARSATPRRRNTGLASCSTTCSAGSTPRACTAPARRRMRHCACCWNPTAASPAGGSAPCRMAGSSRRSATRRRMAASSSPSPTSPPAPGPKPRRGSAPPPCRSPSTACSTASSCTGRTAGWWSPTGSPGRATTCPSWNTAAERCSTSWSPNSGRAACSARSRKRPGSPPR